VTPLLDFEHAGVRCLVIEGPVGALCAYVGVPADHPLAGKSDTDPALDDLSVHGGLTFADEGDGRYRPAGWYWYGWDYAHAGDLIPGLHAYPGDRAWTVGEVEAEARAAAEVFAVIAQRAVEGWS
jgi:hypothetical protein